MKNAFNRASITGDVVFDMSQEARCELAQSAIRQLVHIDWTRPEAGEHAMQRILQPLFALSGYRLRAEAENVADVRFDLIGESLLGNDDKVYVDFKFSSTKIPRSMIPAHLIDFLVSLPPSDPSRLVFVSNAGFSPAVVKQFRGEYGPRFELWDFGDVRSKLESLAIGETERDDTLIRALASMLDELAIGLAESSVDIRRVEWRDLERVVAHVLKALGYAVRLTNASHDGGRDIIVLDVTSPEFGAFNVEIKHWTEKPAGSREAKRLLEVSMRERRQGALLLATSGVSPAAVRVRTEYQKDYLRFGDDNKVIITCRTFARKRQGLWITPQPFRSFLLHETH